MAFESFQCVVCGAIFATKNTTAKRPVCSIACAEGLEKIQEPKDDPLVEPANRQCVICGRVFETDPDSPKLLCSAECRSKASAFQLREMEISRAVAQSNEQVLDFDDAESEAEKARAQIVEPIKRFTGDPELVAMDLDSAISLLAAIRAQEQINPVVVLSVVELVRGILSDVSRRLSAGDQDREVRQVDHLPPG